MAQSVNVEISGTSTSPTNARPPAVLSHGVGSDTTVWSTMIGALSNRGATYAWDQPGHGKSAPVAPDAYGPGLAYSSLKAVVEQAQDWSSRQVTLIGHSLGGYLSTRYTLEHPDRVAALVLIATGPGFRAVEAREKWNDDTRRQAEKQNRPEMLVGLHEDSFVMDHLADLSRPTLVIVGADDKAFLGATDYIERKVPGCERHTIVGAGHMAPETHGEEIASLVVAFLDRVGA